MKSMVWNLEAPRIDIYDSFMHSSSPEYDHLSCNLVLTSDICEWNTKLSLFKGKLYSHILYFVVTLFVFIDFFAMLMSRIKNKLYLPQMREIQRKMKPYCKCTVSVMIQTSPGVSNNRSAVFCNEAWRHVSKLITSYLRTVLVRFQLIDYKLIRTLRNMRKYFSLLAIHVSRASGYHSGYILFFLEVADI